MEFVLDNSRSIANIRQLSHEINEKIERDITQTEIELKRAEFNLMEKKELLPLEKYEEHVRAFNEQVSSTQKKFQKQKHQLNNSHQLSRQKVYDHILDTVKKIAQDQKIDLILQMSQVLYVDKELDITNEVLEKSNQQEIDIGDFFGEFQDEGTQAASNS